MKLQCIFVMKNEGANAWEHLFNNLAMMVTSYTEEEKERDFRIGPTYGQKMYVSFPVRAEYAKEQFTPIFDHLVHLGVIEGGYQLGE